MENVNSEDDVGVSPQWLAVRVRLQGGLIPAYRDSFLCRPGSASEPGLLTDGHFPCAAFCLLSCHRELLLRGDLPFNTSTGDLRSVHVRGLETGTIK